VTPLDDLNTIQSGISSRVAFLDKYLSRLLTKTQIYLFLGVLFTALALFLLGTIVPMPDSAIQVLNQQYANTTQTITAAPLYIKWATIVANNLHIALLEMVPVLGLIIIAVSSFDTGQLIHAVALGGSLYPGANPLVVGVELFVFPHAVVEFSAYALAISSSMLFVWALIRRRGAKEAAKTFLVAIGGTFILLAVAGFLETLLYVSALFAAVMWFPVVYVVIKLRRKAIQFETEGLNSTPQEL